MTTLSKDEILRLAREAADKDKVDPVCDGFVTLTTEELVRFAALCRADLVVDVDSWKKVSDWNAQSGAFTARRLRTAEAENERLQAENETLRYEVDAIAGIKAERDELRAEVARLQDGVRLRQQHINHMHERSNWYEELRQSTDGGSESMTHDDALKQIAYWRDCVVERDLLRTISEGLKAELAALRAGSGEPVAWALFRQDEDGLEPVMFYGGKEKPEGVFKDRFELHSVYTTPQPSAVPLVSHAALKDAARLALDVLNSYDAEEFKAGKDAISALKAEL